MLPPPKSSFFKIQLAVAVFIDPDDVEHVLHAQIQARVDTTAHFGTVISPDVRVDEPNMSLANSWVSNRSHVKSELA